MEALESAQPLSSSSIDQLILLDIFSASQYISSSSRHYILEMRKSTGTEFGIQPEVAACCQSMDVLRLSWVPAGWSALRGSLPCEAVRVTLGDELFVSLPPSPP